MGLFLSLVYIVISYTKPEVFFPVLADARVALLLGIAAILFSVPKLAANPYLFRVPQTYSLLLLLGAVFISLPLHGWVGGSTVALGIFLPQAIVYFLVVANVDSWKRLKLAVVAVLLTTIFMALQGVHQFYLDKGLPEEGSMLLTGQAARAARSTQFVLREATLTPEGDAAIVYRLRSVGNLSDPNDFSQFLIVGLPLLWLGWKKRRFMNNGMLLIIAGMLLYACFLTHSRGAMLGVAVILLVAMKDKLGMARSGMLSGLMLALFMVLGFTGGRAVGDSAGRLEEWGNGLLLLKQFPFFGVGFGNFKDSASDDYTYLTAHNSFVLCFTELGITGYVCWIGAIVIVYLGLNALVKAARSSLARPKADELPETNGPDKAGDHPTDASNISEDRQGFRLLRWGKLIRLSLVAFLFTSWFLSRTYAITLYLLLGIATALIRLGGEQLELELPPIETWAKVVASSTFASIAAVWAFIRI